jgi:hypothetical protein
VPYDCLSHQTMSTDTRVISISYISLLHCRAEVAGSSTVAPTLTQNVVSGAPSVEHRIPDRLRFQDKFNGFADCTVLV